MKTSRFIAVAAMLLLLPCSAYAQDATITLTATSVATGVGTTQGQGVLNYKGQEIPFKMSSFQLLGLGVSKITATGTVHNLSYPEKFDGVYDTKGIDGALVYGKGKTNLKNDSGVIISLKSDEVGLKLGATLGGARMTLDADALAKALAALNAPPVKAQYQASVYFNTGKYDIQKTQDAALNKTISYLKQNPSAEVILSGYADTTGTEKGNQTLSEKRAGAVFETLKRRAQGTSITKLPPKRVEVIGRGQIGSQANTADQKNRRVDILIIAPTRAQMSTTTK